MRAWFLPFPLSRRSTLPGAVGEQGSGTPNTSPREGEVPWEPAKNPRGALTHQPLELQGEQAGRGDGEQHSSCRIDTVRRGERKDTEQELAVRVAAG